VLIVFAFVEICGTFNTMNLVVRIRPGTRKKLNQICRAQRWTMIEALDALADTFLAKQHQQREPSPTESMNDDPVGPPANAEPVGAHG